MGSQHLFALHALAGIALLLALCTCAAGAAAVVELTPDNVDQYIPHSNKSVLAYFYASWCGHCTSFAPEFAAAAETFMSQSDDVIFAKGDADTHKALGKFVVSGYPTIMLYIAGSTDISDGRLFTGARNKDGVIAWLNSLLATAVNPSWKAVQRPKTVINAIFDDDVAGLQELIAAGASAHEMREGAPAIYWAAELGRKDMVKILADSGADYSWEPACLMGDLEHVERHLRRGVDVNYKEPTYGTTCLMLAAEKGYAELIALLAQHGVRLNDHNKNGNTALIKAAEFGQMSALRALVEAGASLLHRNNAGKTALDVASEENRTEAKECPPPRLPCVFASC
jgi:protein disulfide-isomerase-like protein